MKQNSCTKPWQKNRKSKIKIKKKPTFFFPDPTYPHIQKHSKNLHDTLHKTMLAIKDDDLGNMVALRCGCRAWSGGQRKEEM
jgi:hypothetical protein